MGDHIGGAGVMARKTSAPIYIPEQSYKVKSDMLKGCVVNFINGGESIIIGDLQITAFSTKHDSMGSVGFVVTDLTNGKSYGHLTDTGIVTPIIKEALKTCDAFFIECDYDEESLEKNAEYDETLKTRIRSPLGHLSNQQAIKYMKNNIDMSKTEFIILGHLSRKNNSIDLLKTQVETEIGAEFIDKFYISFDKVKLELK